MRIKLMAFAIVGIFGAVGFASIAQASAEVSRAPVPLVTTDDAQSFQSFALTLRAGWNLVCLPLSGYGYRASTLGLSGGDMVLAWNYPYHPLGYLVYIVGLPLNDFAILPGQGYWIYVTLSKTLTIFGEVPSTPQTIAIPPGGTWGFFGFLGFKTWHASQIAKMVNGSAVIVLAKFDSITKMYVTYVPGLPLNDFTVAPGQACAVYTHDGGTITYLP